MFYRGEEPMRQKNQSTRGFQAVAILGTTMALSSLAGADVITARFDEVAPGRGVSFSIDSGGSFSGTQAGSFRWTRLGGDYAGSGASGSFTTYCIELSQHISYGSTYDYTTRAADLSPVPGSGMGADRAALLSELFGRFYVPQFTSNDEAAAFQVAIWEITHDDGLSLNAGLFQIEDEGSLSLTAQSWLDALDGSGPRLQLLAMTSEIAQDQIFVVPAASSAGLMLVASVFGCSSRRRRSIQPQRA